MTIVDCGDAGAGVAGGAPRPRPGVTRPAPGMPRSRRRLRLYHARGIRSTPHPPGGARVPAVLRRRLAHPAPI